MKKNKPVIVIKEAFNWTYYQWFILGLFELQKLDEITLRFELPILDKLLLYSNSDRLNELIRKAKKKIQKYSPLLWGEYRDRENRVLFCIDYEDSPYMFSLEGLHKTDVYFKIQCPKDLESKDFPLTDEIHIPWTAYEHIDEELTLGDTGPRKTIADFKKYMYKIRPLMLGPRRLGNGLGYKGMKKAYDNFIKSQTNEKTKKIMCYFGDSQGPIPSENIKEPDLNREKEIMGFWNTKLNHPNEKRAIVAGIISELGDQADARVIHWGNSDIGKRKVKNNEIPLSDFCDHISNFEYNVNVSGYRLSIPGRFCESFMVGTGIVTDKLSVRWYAPFDPTIVIESIKMGYNPMDDVDWSEFRNTINELPTLKKEYVLSDYEAKWAPISVAKYIVKELAEKSVEKR